MSDPSKITPDHIQQAAANLTRQPEPVSKPTISRLDLCTLLVLFAASNALWSGFGVTMYAGWHYAAQVFSALATALSGVGVGYFAMAMYRRDKK